MYTQITYINTRDKLGFRFVLPNLPQTTHIKPLTPHTYSLLRLFSAQVILNVAVPLCSRGRLVVGMKRRLMEAVLLLETTSWLEYTYVPPIHTYLNNTTQARKWINTYLSMYQLTNIDFINNARHFTHHLRLWNNNVFPFNKLIKLCLQFQNYILFVISIIPFIWIFI